MKRLMVACLLVIALVAACGGGDEASDDQDPVTDPTEDTATEDAGGDEDDSDEAAAEADFTCPIAVADVEAAYQPIQFEEPTNDSGSDCTFRREDGIGSLVLQVFSEDAEAAYAQSKATVPDAEAVDVGDEAVWSEGRTVLFALVGDKMIAVQAVSMIGVGGEDTDIDEQLRLVKEGSIQLGNKAAAEI